MVMKGTDMKVADMPSSGLTDFHTPDAYEDWLADGTTDSFDNPLWRDYLPLDDDGVLHLSADLAVELSLIHSTGYQSQLETLYLSALDVSSERFRFDTQFFGGYSSTYQSRGNSGFGSSDFDLSTRGIQARRALTSGAEMVIGLANSLTWQFSGPDTYSANTLIDFTLVQPLLRGAGREGHAPRFSRGARRAGAVTGGRTDFRCIGPVYGGWA